jgi:hypothetical protein
MHEIPPYEVIEDANQLQHKRSPHARCLLSGSIAGAAAAISGLALADRTDRGAEAKQVTVDAEAADLAPDDF